ncbi:MAG: right-handed parallel beta-helix repeat-containing protein, partial [Clostridia bacterium]|nr:right-handed parallel beta-helix repeat-containing protein [Clostridia bacterium]
SVTNATVDSCIFENIGAQAVYIRGDNVEVDDPGVTKNITVNNNIISGYGRVFYNAVGILVIHANSVNVTHNEIHDGYYTAISVGWSWGYGYSVTYNNKICDNLIYNIGQGWLSDMGGIYTLGVQTGTVLSGNVIHNVAADPDEGGYGGWGIYLDEGSSGILVEKNLAYACGSDCYHLHYGENNTVRNNIFALSADSQIHAVSKGEGHKTADFTGNIVLTDKNTPAFSYLTTAEEFHADGNIVWNLSYGDKTYTDENSLFSMSMPVSTAEKKGLLNNCIFIDPLFTDPQSFDFTFSDGGKAVSQYGFEAWDYSSAGTLKESVIGLDRAGGQTGYNDSAEPQELHPADTRINPAGVLLIVAVILGAAVLILAVIAAKKAGMPAGIVFIAVPVVSAAICAWLNSVFVHWNPTVYAVLLALLVLLAGLVSLFAKKRDSKKAAFLAYLIPTVIFAALFVVTVMVLNNVLRIGEQRAILSGFVVAGAFYAASFVFALKKQISDSATK